ncbi:MAG: trypsin-like serine peptidase [Planctomycetaceae bacterium]
MNRLESRRLAVLSRLGQRREAAAEGTLESQQAAVAADLSQRPIDEIVGETVCNLRRYAERFLDNNAKALALIEQLKETGKRGLQLSRKEPGHLAHDEPALGGLEAIVLATGERPSFLIRDNAVVPDSSWTPPAEWLQVISGQSASLAKALQCVGRIDVAFNSAEVTPTGSGFLVQENLVLTNRHVAQKFARQSDSGWRMEHKAWIDFGQEGNGRGEWRRRQIRGVVFAGPDRIHENAIDHQRLDLALLELEPPNHSNRTPLWLAIDTRSTAVREANAVFVVGYPIDDQDFYPDVLMQMLFTSDKFLGKKRLAPGRILPGRELGPTTVKHDATTIGGNSGSVILRDAGLRFAAALHYGGSPFQANWAHVLGEVLDLRGSDGTTFREICTRREVTLG